MLLDLNSLPKGFDGSLKPAAITDIDDENFETPYLGLSREADLFASVTSFPDSSVASVTIFDPKTQTWHYLPARTKGTELAQKVAAFLAPRLAASAVQDQISPTVSSKTKPKSSKIHQVIFTAIAFTIACLPWAIQTNSSYHHLKVQVSRTFPGLLNIEKK